MSSADMKEQISKLNKVKSDAGYKKAIDDFIFNYTTNYPTSFSSSDERLSYGKDIVKRLEELLEGLRMIGNVPSEAGWLYFGLDSNLFVKIPAEALECKPVNFIFKESMFKKGEEPFEFNGREYKRIFSEDQRALINFFKHNKELLPHSAQDFLSSAFNSRKNSDLEFPFNEISNGFNYRIFLNLLPEAINLEFYHSFLKIHHKANEGKARAKTLIYMYKSLEDKYSDYLGSKMVDGFKRDFKSRIINSLKNEFEGYTDEYKNISLLKSEIGIAKEIFDNLDPNDLYYSIVPVFIDVLKDEESVQTIDKYFLNRLRYEISSSFLKFTELSSKKQKELLIDAKSQFLKRFPDLSKK